MEFRKGRREQRVGRKPFFTERTAVSEFLSGHPADVVFHFLTSRSNKL